MSSNPKRWQLRSYAVRIASVVALPLLAVALVACAPQAPSGDAPGEGEPQVPTVTADAGEVEEELESFVVAWEEEDVEAAVGAFQEDAVAFDPVPPGKFAGIDEIRAWITNSFEQLDGIDITISERDVRTAGRTAWVTGRYVFNARPVAEAAEPVRDEGYLTMIFLLRDDGSYAATLFHASRLPEAPTEGE